MSEVKPLSRRRHGFESRWGYQASLRSAAPSRTMDTPSERTRETREDLSLSEAAEHLLEECRMVLPGIQALFGFQLIVVFNPAFGQRLTTGEQRLHLLAIALLAVAIA